MNKNLLWFAEEIENMDLTIHPDDAVKFEEVLLKYLEKHDPENESSIAEVVSQMTIKEVTDLHNELLQFNYEEE
ncbi:hypothetical protein [Priestia megaterium]|jgi:hypothetical protein|uniref:hypothetical protein n=1 Tax=Priestia megaterium TaxID=1404 RepID=UPI000BEBA7BD|nr:hypothetical protein [Priestia megaterium]PED63956.1 hypothetical protein CON20_23600 [Priestia megaterium]